MKSTLKLTLRVWLLLLLVASCSSTGANLPTNLAVSPVSNYGYSAHHPVAIWAPTGQSKQDKIARFLKGLRSENGAKMEIVSKTTVKNPHYKAPKIKFYNIFTGEIINKQQGKYVEKFLLHSLGEEDTIAIYIDPYTKAPLMIPSGLDYASY